MALLQMQSLHQINATAKQAAQNTILPLPRLQAASRRVAPLTQRSRSQLCRAVESAEQQQQAQQQVQPEAAVPGMSAYLDSLRWAKDGLVPVIVQVGRLDGFCGLLYHIICSLHGTFQTLKHPGSGNWNNLPMPLLLLPTVAVVQCCCCRVRLCSTLIPGSC